MKLKKIFFVFVLFISQLANAQDAATLYQTGRKFMVEGDLDNALIVLKKVYSMEPENTIYLKELTQVYYYKGDYENAKLYADDLVKKDDADEQVFYLASTIYAAKDDAKNAEKIVKKGISKFEKSGILYNLYGDILVVKNPASAITQWEKGIQHDPNFASNYYNAAKYYFNTKDITDKIWAAYYGEIFVNLESYTIRTVETKKQVLDAYKLMLTNENFAGKNSKNDFVNLYKENLLKQRNVINIGITTESLIKLRTLFILNWYKSENTISNSLYERHQQLLKEGLFETYNYWFFEPIQDANSFENWLKLHNASFQDFSKYHQNKLFKLKNGEYLK
jgi:tetratricopeptide (TPR) repeat protein